jgi:ferredoxin--NADP+ reductase
MIGLPGGAKPVVRAYSIASPGFAEELEFLSIKVEDGPLTSRLQKIQVGDEILLGKKSTGTLVLDALTAAKNLYLVSTGTGLAPFLSLIRDPETYERFERVHVAHTVRQVKDLCYSELLSGGLHEDPLVGEEAQGRFVYYPTVTRESFQTTGRITDRILSGALFQDLGFARGRFDPAEDRIMLCGSMAMIKETAAILDAQGLKEGSNSEPGDYVIERAFVG